MYSKGTNERKAITMTVKIVNTCFGVDVAFPVAALQRVGEW